MIAAAVLILILILAFLAALVRRLHDVHCDLVAQLKAKGIL